jgi:2-methylisocitrate lyase-like PEP mutase family enzyme
MTASSASARAFHDLQARGELLMLPNAWDALSARLAVQAGARAVATSSAAVAWSLGYADGQCLPFEDLAAAVARIIRAAAVPVSVDLERGYGDTPDDVAASVARMADLGAAGVNLEDGAEAPERLALSIAAVRARTPEIFVNARTCLVIKHVVASASCARLVLARAQRYEAAGAHGLFVPGLIDASEMQAVSRGTRLALHVMAMPGLPPAATLAESGVRRLSTGPGSALAAYARAAEAMRLFVAAGERAAALTYQDAQAMFAATPRPASSTTASGHAPSR